MGKIGVRVVQNTERVANISESVSKNQKSVGFKYERVAKYIESVYTSHEYLTRLPILGTLLPIYPTRLIFKGTLPVI